MKNEQTKQLVDRLVRAVARMEAPPYFAARVAAHAQARGPRSVIATIDALARRFVPLFVTLALCVLGLALFNTITSQSSTPGALLNELVAVDADEDTYTLEDLIVSTRQYPNTNVDPAY